MSQFKRNPNPIDMHVGNKVRVLRMLAGMSQETLAELVGLTFQQIQKYENGVNRLGASKLFLISQVLDVPVQKFFEDLPGMPPRSGKHKGNDIPGFHDSAGELDIMGFLGSTEAIQLNRSFCEIEYSDVRRRVVELLRTLARRYRETDAEKSLEENS